MSSFEKSAAKPLHDTVAGFGEGLGALSHARSPEASDPHSTERLQNPQHTNFGDFEEKLTYVGKVNPEEELAPTEKAVAPVGVVIAVLEREGRRRIVQLGRREATNDVLEKFEKTTGVANPNGEYVIYVEEEDGSVLPPIILGAEELPKLIQQDGEIRFGTDHTSHSVAGAVRKIVAFR